MENLNNTINKRAEKLAQRIALGANSLFTFAEQLTDAEWNTPVIGDGRTIGIVVHHVASVYPMEIELAQMLAAEKPITGATIEVVNKMNADHAEENKDITKQETLDLLKHNSSIAVKAVQQFTDKELDNSATVSLNYDAPLTTQFFIEDHAHRHSYHHLAKIKASLPVLSTQL